MRYRTVGGSGISCAAMRDGLFKMLEHFGPSSAIKEITVGADCQSLVVELALSSSWRPMH